MNNGEKAVYLPQMLDEYKDSPFIEALPPIMSAKEVTEVLTVDSGYSEAEREMDEYYRFHCVRRLFQYFQPLYTHIDIEQRISCGIRQGYLHRNPVNGKQTQYIGRSSAMGFTIIGMSGIGKTTGIERVLSLYPQCITHTKYNGKPFYVKQLTWLKLDCPFDGSIKGLCISFFSAIDKILDSTYSQKFYAARNTVDMLLPKMARIAETHGLGLLIIDEIQHLSQAKSGGSEKMLNFFVTLVNTIGVPVVLIGTTKALPILQSEFRQARRGSGQGDLIWERMKKDESWDIMLHTMWKYQWTRTRTKLTSELSNVLYDKSQGITDIAVKLYAMSQVKAIADRTECITVTAIKEAADEKFRLVKPMLAALRSGDVKKIAQYEDIRPVSVEDYIAAHSAKFVFNEAYSQKIIPLEEQAVLKLLEMDIPPQTARKCVKKVLSGNTAGQPLGVVVKKAFRMALGMETPADKSEQKLLSDENDIRSVHGDNAYTKLKKLNIIASGTEEI